MAIKPSNKIELAELLGLLALLSTGSAEGEVVPTPQP